ncbi:isoprenyl transferase [Phaeovibrio sulfidiphilus]|uniref:Isoprenyl transferase n=1 Tax=Phaeovibrio sulfidiphilus TaxID=1220600 RepID=A0A8J6YM26_9PROT|nr:isoprenyl transferase [Phaeovibrio sulfidiphilus]
MTAQSPLSGTRGPSDGHPLHVAIIMDGNGRWARARGLPRTAGHRKGAESVRAVVEASPGLGITHLTLFGFSSENWKRPQSEISDLMSLLRFYLKSELRNLAKHNVCLRVIGRRDRFSQDVLDLIAEAEHETGQGTGLQLTIALNYGSRLEIVDAVKDIAREVAAGTLDPETIGEADVNRHLTTRDLPDPDVLIRTSGEQRISNFLLWQAAYAELVFSPVLWPDFNGQHLADALADYRTRERRFGGV